jgi:hypothetical protein
MQLQPVNDCQHEITVAPTSTVQLLSGSDDHQLVKQWEVYQVYCRREGSPKRRHSVQPARDRQCDCPTTRQARGLDYNRSSKHDACGRTLRWRDEPLD